MLGPLPARSTAVPGFHITTQDDLPGPDGDEPYGLFVNETEYGNRRFLRTNVHPAIRGPEKDSADARRNRRSHRCCASPR